MRSTRSFWRLLVAWLMLLAIPVQGMAAADMRHCRAAGALVTAVADGHHAQHEAHAGHAAAHAAHASQSDPAGDHHGTPAGHQCSVCAACMMAFALPTPVCEFAPGAPAVARFAAPVLARVSFLVSGPERPPRRLA